MIIYKIFLQLYKKSRDLFYKIVGIKVSNKPMMKYEEIDLIKEVIQKIKPVYCLEWGCGYSTLYFPDFIDKKATWLSIEHDFEWFNRINTLNCNSMVEINYIESSINNNKIEFNNYLSFPKSISNKYDLILIDGRSRVKCITEAVNLLNENGVVILHDANRKRYHNVFNLYKYSEYFQSPYKDAYGIWLGSNDIPINYLINIKKQKVIWKFHNLLTHIFKLGE